MRRLLAAIGTTAVIATSCTGPGSTATLAAIDRQPAETAAPTTVVTTTTAPQRVAATPATSTTRPPVWVAVKYRSDSVNIAAPGFECVDTSSSSLVSGACYDRPNEYLVIGLEGTNYHYCRLSEPVWDSFTAASSFGSYYRTNIMGSYDCRLGGVPVYE